MNKKNGSLYTLQKGIIILGILLTIVALTIGLIAEIDRLIRAIKGVEPGVALEGQNLEGYLASEVESLIYFYSKKSIKYPDDARINKLTGEIIAEQNGRIIDLEETLADILAAEEGSNISMISYQIEPYLYEEDLESLKRVVGSYRTVVRGSEGRKDNIKVAARAINNTLVAAEDICSFNQVVGPRTKEGGFTEAPEIINGKLSLGIGGGICQVSTTLYNALLTAKIKIVERHSHSKDVSYVPDGQDAAVAWDYLDLKFKNNFSTPILIKAAVNGSQLTINIIASTKED